MQPLDPTSRRKFMVASGMAIGAASLPGSAAVAAQGPDRSHAAVLERLIAGNKRFSEGKATQKGRTPADFAALADGQAPLAAIVGCADSRVTPELVFDQGVGDLFVVRVAGNVVSGTGASLKGSLEFAVAELGVRLIMVLGHGACGAVKAAIAHIDANDTLPGSIRELVDMLRPAAAAVRDLPGDKLENAIKANVERNVERLKTLDPILAPMVKSGELKVVGAVYELRTGLVKMI